MERAKWLFRSLCWVKAKVVELRRIQNCCLEAAEKGGEESDVSISINGEEGVVELKEKLEMLDSLLKKERKARKELEKREEKAKEKKERKRKAKEAREKERRENETKGREIEVVG